MLFFRKEIAIKFSILNSSIQDMKSTIMHFEYSSKIRPHDQKLIPIVLKSKSIVPHVVSQVGRAMPSQDLLSKLKNFSRGVAFVAVDKNDNIECKA